MQRDKESVAEKMREKQRLGRAGNYTSIITDVGRNLTMGHVTADERKAAEAAKK